MSTEERQSLSTKIENAISSIAAKPPPRRTPLYKYLNAYSRLLRDLNNKEILRLQQEVAKLREKVVH